MKRLVLAMAAGLVGWVSASFGADKTIVLIAGKPSHPPGMHEFRAGCLLLQKCLAEVPGLVTRVYSNGWPGEANALVDADAVVIYADGGAGHPAIQGDHRQILGALAGKGVGLGFMHYGVEIPSTNGGPEFLEWVGGYYEPPYSGKPVWCPGYPPFPSPPVISGRKTLSATLSGCFYNAWGRRISDAVSCHP